jgi:hypothetical protein
MHEYVCKILKPLKWEEGGGAGSFAYKNMKLDSGGQRCRILGNYMKQNSL